MEKELKNTKLDLDALRSEADSLFEEGNYQGALDCYLILYKFCSDDFLVIYNIATCYLKTGKFDDAIKYYDLIFNFDKEIYKDKLQSIYYYRGHAHYLNIVPNDDLNNKYEMALKDFLMYTKMYPQDKAIFGTIGDCYLELGETSSAAEWFVKSGVDVLEKVFDPRNKKLISLMLDFEVKSTDNSTLFSKAMSEGGINDTSSADYNKYKKIYIKVLDIITLLHVNLLNNENERSVAHYTRIDTAEKLVFRDDNPFRLNTILIANDPKEGLDLLEFFDLNKTDSDESGDFQAFIGSFTFNHDSLNQFRLYGKENDKEATGISLVFNRKFFKLGAAKNGYKSGDKKNDDEDSKKSLFRCIYVDPVTKQLISIGQREAWTFYRENENVKRADRLIKRSDILFNSVKDELKKLKDLIDDLGGNKKVNVLSELLLMLRYLTKNMAFKEEQECRVLTIENITQNPNILPKKEDGDFSQMYIEYRTVKDCIDKVYFAPKAKGQEMFNNQIKRFGLNIKSYQSIHKIS